MHIQQFPQLAKLYPQKRAIITGAGGGLGFELTKFLAMDDWRILCMDLDTTAIEAFQNASLTIHKLDITNRVVFEKAITAFCTKQQGVDLLINNAGVGEGAIFKDYPLTHWDWIIDINLKAVISGTYFALPYMLEQNSGTIVNIASMAGIANLPKMSPYNTTKAAVISLSETISHELSKTKIRVKCVTPTFFQSSILQHSKGDTTTLQSAQKFITNSKLSSRDAALLILKNLHKNQEIFRFPFTANLFFYSRRWFPNIYRYMIRKILVRTA